MEKLRARREYLVGLILLFIVCFPMLKQGIMCNDEMQLRLWRQQGWKTFFKTTIISENLNNGRILGIFGNIKFLSYISEEKYLFRIVGILFLIIAISLFGYIAYRFTKEKGVAGLLSTLILVFLPITFEHAVPNAFLIVSIQPLILLELSIISYLNYIEQYKKKHLIVSIIFFLWAMFLYEFVITYVLLFPAIYFIKNCNKNLKIKKLIQASVPMIITAVIYLFLYIMQGIVFPTNYAGNQLGIKSLSAVLNVLKTLFLSALPGYYAFVNDKYDYLFKVYNNGEINVENIRNMILWLFVLSFFYILYKILFREEQKGSAGLKKSIMMAVVAFIYCFLPALPNAVSVMYQENCSDTFFTSLPVSIFLYFAVMFLITLLLWGLLKKFNKKVFKIFLILIITFSASIIQINNYVFAEEQSRNFARIEEIEEFLQMEYVSILEGEKVTAPSLYETRNTLAIEAEHWTKYTAIYGKHIEILGNTDENTNWKLEMQDDNSFFLYDSEQKFLIAKDERAETFGVRNVDKELIIVQNAGCMYTEDNYYVYLLEEAE